MVERRLELRDRFLAPIAVTDAASNVVGANLGALVRRLVLFEQVVIDSYAMREIPYLINAIGPEQLVDLVDSGALKIRAEGWTFGEIGGGGFVPGYGSQPLPLLQYSLSPITIHNREDHISLCLGEIRGMGLQKRVSQRVRNAVVRSLLQPPEGAGSKSLEALPRDFTRNLNLVYGATALALSKALGRPVSEDDFEIRIDQADEHVYVATTDIATRFGLADEATDKVVQDSLLSIASLNQRLEEIEAYEALIGFQETEIALAHEKLAFLVSEVDPGVQEDRFNRVVTIAGLPDPETTGASVNIAKLIEVRNSDEIRQFRLWLRTLDAASDEEIAERVASIRARLSEAVHSKAGRSVRFLTTTGIGMIPVVGPIAGLAFGAVDTFLVDTLLPEPGPVSFIGTTYPSIYR